MTTLPSYLEMSNAVMTVMISLQDMFVEVSVYQNFDLLPKIWSQESKVL